MSASAASAAPSQERDLDRAVAELREHARELARMPAADKARLLRQCVPRIAEAAAEWAKAGTSAKGLAPDQTAEEWLSGPVPTIRTTRLLCESLEAIAQNGRPPLGTGYRMRRDDRLEIEVFPVSTFDKLLFAGFRGHVLMPQGVTLEQARERQASFFRKADPEGGVSLVLGAGNVSSIPPLDAVQKMFVEGSTCLLKMNPVNEWSGTFVERAFAPLVERGFLRIVYGGADVGKYLVYHDGIDDVHITGSDKTHDAIVWGPPGPEQDRRKAENDRLLTKPISSELGNVSPVAIVPYTYSDDELNFQARNVVTMLANNASFNCNAAKMLITARDWPQRERFFDILRTRLAAVPPRRAYYPGAEDRYRALTEGRELETFGQAGDGQLPWTLIREIDSQNTGDRIFRDEPFCSILSETTVGSADPVEFLSSATRFMNETLWGTLNACIIIHPKLESDSAVGAELDRSIVELRYGTVAINHWPALGYGLGSTPWGGHPSATLDNIQSGLGWVHNTFMLEGMDKSVVRGGLRVRPTPVWFYGNRKASQVAPRLVAMEAKPSWLKLPGLVLKAL